MSAGPKQYLSINWVQVSTEEFIKNREAILARLKKEEKKEPWQMMNNAQKKFNDELKKAEDSIEKEVETPVPTVSETTTLGSEKVELNNVPLEDENVSEKVDNKTKPKKKVEWKVKKK